MTFEAFGLDPLVIDGLKKMGFEKPTPIQEEAIPLIMQGKDLIALAETGSGKTAACAIPICHRIDTASSHIQALIVVPTRELALQYATEAQRVGRLRNVRSFALLGGESLELQKAKLKDGVQLLVATPGRLIDFIFTRSIDLSHVHTFVMDEADQMLSMGFIEDLEFIMQCMVQEHQTLLFSATMPEQIRLIAKLHMRTPLEIVLTRSQPTPEQLAHIFSFCAVSSKKQEELIELLHALDPKQCLIFANSRHEVENLFRELKRRLSSVDFLHGGLDQDVRTIITNKFSKGKIRYLVATDVASRGLDFSHVTHVFNFHFPFEEETYLHRAGRTARQGRIGTCVTLVTRRELIKVERLLKTLQREPEWIKKPPSSPPMRRGRKEA